MDISKLNPQQELNAANEIDDDLKIDFDKDELSEELKTKKDQENAKNETKKKRRFVQSRSVAAFYENHDVQTLLKQSSNKSEKTQLDQLKEKVKQGFNKELNDFITEAKQPKAATLLQKNIKPNTIKTQAEAPINEETETTTISQKEQTKETLRKTTKHAQILKQPELHTPLKNYIALFGENQLKESPEKKEKLRTIKQSLQTKGVSHSQLLGIEKGVQNLIHTDLKRLLKNKFTDLAFAFEKKPTGELLNNFSKYYSVLDFAKEANMFDAAPQSLNQLKEDVKKDITNFITSELDRSVVETKLKSDSTKELLKAFDQFNNLTGFTKFDTASYLTSFQQKLNNEGLTPFLTPDQRGSIDTQEHNQSNQHQNQKDNQQETPEETEELEQQLLNLSIKSKLPHSLIDTFKNKLALFKLKQKCKNKNINITTIEKQACALATLRAKMECRSLFEFRATLPSLNSPLYQEFQKKLKPILKTLKKLGHPLTSQDLRLIRDQSNKAIFTIIKEDYIKTTVFLETNPNNTTLLSQKKNFLSILNRIKSETPIKESLTPKMLEDLHFLDDVNINEAA